MLTGGESNMFDIIETFPEDAGQPRIKVIGLGGGGGNAVDYMVRSQVQGVDFICANTDLQALKNSIADVCIQLGKKGLGAGANPEKGKEAAEENIDQVKEHLRSADMIFITAGMGGGTGTGAAPVVAQAAREMGILTVGVVSRPFGFERRGKTAEKGIEELAQHVDSLITVPNDKLLKVLGKDFVLSKAFDYANEVLHGAVHGISDLVTHPGIINVDFEDLKTVMSERGVAMMGVGLASGDDRATKAAEKAIANPLLEDISVSGAKGLLVNITSGADFTLGEFNEVGDVIDTVASPEAKVIIGTSIDESMTDEIRVTVVATGLEKVDATIQSVETKKSEPEVTRHFDTVNARQKPATSQVVQQPTMTSQSVDSSDVQKAPANRAPSRRRRTADGNLANSDSSDYLDIPAFLRRQAD
jgi:cell division protein FtsZ